MRGNENMEKRVPIQILSTQLPTNESFVEEAGISMQSMPEPLFDFDFTRPSVSTLLDFDWPKTRSLRNRMPSHPFFMSLFLACSNTPMEEQSQPNISSEATALHRYRAYVNQSLIQTKASLSIKDEAIQSGRSYGSLQDLSVVVHTEELPCTLYFKDGDFVLLYVSGEQATYTVKSLHKQFPNADAVTPSRAGKRFSHYVVPDKGIAWSDDGEELAFIEVFPATTLNGWKDTLYTNPGDFYK